MASASSRSERGPQEGPAFGKYIGLFETGDFKLGMFEKVQKAPKGGRGYLCRGMNANKENALILKMER